MSLIGNYNLNYFQIEQSRFTDFCGFISQLNDYHERKELEEKESMKDQDTWF